MFYENIYKGIIIVAKSTSLYKITITKFLFIIEPET